MGGWALACLDAMAARDMDSRYLVFFSSPTNWLNCECVLLEKYTCNKGGGDVTLTEKDHCPLTR